jgi:ubiquinone/menaquinone biosynthesis C-methylase UbiE
MKWTRTRQAEKLAKIYDAEVAPIWSRRFGRMMLRDLRLPPRAMVLDVVCGTGWASLELLRKMDDHGRIIAIDPRPPMLDEARLKSGPLAGKRIFFRSESALPRLSFADDVYDLVVCNAQLQDFDDPEQAVRDFVRVAKPEGQVVVTLPLAGTYREFFDIFREVLTKLDRTEAIDKLDAYLTRFPPLEQATAWCEDAGLVDVHTDYDTFTVLFKSSREFFFAPLIEYGPLADWKAIAGKGEDMQQVFWQCKEAIDAYFGGGSFAITVEAGCLRGRKDPAAMPVTVDPDAVTTGEVELKTGEIEIMDLGRRELGGDGEGDDDDDVGL